MTSDASSDPARPDPEHRAGFVAVVFDKDGVLTDTEVIWDEVRRDLAAGAGVPGPADHAAERTTGSRSCRRRRRADWSCSV